MGNIEVFVIVFTLLLGGYLLYVASEYGKKKKALHEQEAHRAMDKLVASLQRPPEQYRVLLRQVWPINSATWDPSNLAVMRELVVSSCSVSGPDGGLVYLPAKFSVRVNEEKQTIHYVVGDDAFDFDV